MCDGRTVAPINLAYEVSTVKRFQNEITPISNPVETYMYKQYISQQNVTEFIKHVQIRHANRKVAEKIIQKVNRKSPPANVFISAFALMDIFENYA